MQEIKVIPNISINGITFGCDRTELRKKFGDNFKEMKKNLFSKNSMDVYKDYHVFYSGSKTFEAIEIFGKINVKVGRKIVFPGKIKELMGVFPNLEKDGPDSYIDRTCSVALTVSTDDPDQIESILFGCRDYFA